MTHLMIVKRYRANSVDVIVSCSELIPALIKLLAFDLAKYFPSENVYNAHNSMDGMGRTLGFSCAKGTVCVFFRRGSSFASAWPRCRQTGGVQEDHGAIRQ